MEDRQPIIVRRVKKVVGGHHGGAWKVAYADFVTAMMAFFLVLWLIATSTPKQRAAIEAYFHNPTGFVSGGSAHPIDLKGSASVVQQTSADQAPNQITIPEKTVTQLADTIEQRKMQDLLQDLKNKVDTDKTLQKFKDQLLIDITDEGLRIQIVDRSKRPMFDSGSDELKYYSEDLLFSLAKLLGKLPNKISITGHTDSSPYVGRPGYTNWELSADRANAARRALVAGGVSPDQIARVEGLGDSVPFDKSDPTAPVNRRISIIVLNKKTAENIQKNASAGGDAPIIDLTKPTPDQSKKAEKSLKEGDWFKSVKPDKPGPVNW